ncbi:hypothetical protein ROLI_004990 [Roseobacter fucihabitans]|uniref:DUF6473 domain-containing protein n=1 Tax=Roseobacter fucihabitans TaxID=1537242 RepID=A0ABZ2BN37_9RHOB|nr:DUF6473 family protein [Roseobacter litoralis]MBC6964673.1 hypothetical protein [Roseobacter litoralis]
MTYDVLGAGALDYAPCRYGNSKLLFRGPERRIDVPYVAFLGGTETYGKFIKCPYPALVESDLGVNCINFGISNAGIDVMLCDQMLGDAANGAEVTVIQVIGAQNLSNRFYTVHPRRNDRFVSASTLLMSIYPEVDFAEFHFTKHMLSCLLEVSTDRFSAVKAELQMAWSARMKLLMNRISGQKVLLWFSDHPPLEEGPVGVNPSMEKAPLFVTRKMLKDLNSIADGYVEVVATPQALAAGVDGMVFSQMEAMAAAEMLGPKAHGEVALKLGKVLHSMI